MTAIHRHVIPVDDKPHTIEIGEILHVDSRSIDYVEVWAESAPTSSRTFVVVGTGHAWPEGNWEYVGSAIPTSGELVWHLLVWL